MSLRLLKVYKLSRENTQLENMCDIIFEKNKISWWDSKQNECLCRSSRPRRSLKKALWKISQNSQENICAGTVKLCRSEFSLKASLQRRCFFVNFAKFVRTPFLQNTTGRLLLTIATSTVLTAELANVTVNYDTKTEVYVPIWARSASYQKRAVLVKFEQVSEAVVRRFSSK